MQIEAVTVVAGLDTNCYIITDEKTGKCAVIDPGECSRNLINALERKGIENIEYILLTHGHFDHVGGVEHLREIVVNAKFAISQPDSVLMKQPRKNGSILFNKNAKIPSDPDFIIKDGDIIELGTIQIQVIATPGHTAGGVCFLCEGNLFAGDTMFLENCGRCDLATSDFKSMLDSLNKLAKLDKNTKVFPGHGGTTTIAHEIKYNPYIGDNVYDNLS